MSDIKKFELTPSVSILIAGVLIAGAVVFTNSRPAATAEASPEVPTVASNVAPPSADDHIIGSLTAKTVLIEYSDLECYYCGQAYPTLRQIVQESNGQIAWIHRHFPLESIHPQARGAAIASECVAEQLGNEAFWQFAEAMFADQGKMSTAYYTQVASALGADTAAFNTCVASGKYDAKIDAQASEAMQNGGTGTPYTVIYGGGKQAGVSGALPYALFSSVIKSFIDRQ
jgi:protein-disulfide isomerase